MATRGSVKPHDSRRTTSVGGQRPRESLAVREAAVNHKSSRSRTVSSFGPIEMTSGQQRVVRRSSADAKLLSIVSRRWHARSAADAAKRCRRHTSGPRADARHRVPRRLHRSSTSLTAHVQHASNTKNTANDLLPSARIATPVPDHQRSLAGRPSSGEVSTALEYTKQMFVSSVLAWAGQRTVGMAEA